MNTKSMKKKKQSKENKGSHENVDVDPEDFKEVKKRGALGNLYLKVVGIESTQLEQAFVESMNQHEEYRSQLNKLFTAAELILQPNFLLVNAGKLNEDAFVVKEGSRSFTPYTHPMQRVANHIQALAPFMKPSHGKPDFLSPSDRHILNTLPSRCMDMMDIEKKSRTKTRSLMNRTRLFLSKDMQEFKNNKEEVENHLMIMDDMRNQVKKAKTKAELEKAGKGYAAAVYEFNRRADLIDRVLESHTENVYFHQRDLSRMFGERAKFHFDMMKILQEFDLDVVAVEQRKK